MCLSHRIMHIKKHDLKGTENLEKNMRRIKLTSNITENVNKDYELDPTEQYVINVEEEMESQIAILSSFQIMGAPPALKNYHAWLFENGFNVDSPDPTNEFVSKYYGIKPLWKTSFSQGIVVKNESDEDYYIVMECSSKNKGYKHTKVILTLGGCI